MTISPTRYYSFGRPTIGGSRNIWGEELNDTLDDIDAAIKSQQNASDDYVNKNYVINPCFLINQKYGATLTTLSDGLRFSDMWEYKQSGAGVLKYNPRQDLLGSEGYNERYSMYGAQFRVTTKDDAIAAGDYYYIENSIEGYNIDSLKGQSYLTLSFWVKANKIGTYCVAISNSGNTRSYIQEYSITNTKWNKKEFNFIPGSTGEFSLYRLKWVLACGSTKQYTATTWVSTNTIATINQTNLMETTSARFYLTQVKLEPGTISTLFEMNTLNKELQLCQRYFEKSYDFEYPAGSLFTIGTANIYSFYATEVSSSPKHFIPIRYRVRKYSTSASITSYSPGGATNSVWTVVGNNVSASTIYLSENGGSITPTSGALDQYRLLRANYISEGYIT